MKLHRVETRWIRFGPSINFDESIFPSHYTRVVKVDKRWSFISKPKQLKFFHKDIQTEYYRILQSNVIILHDDLFICFFFRGRLSQAQVDR